LKKETGVGVFSKTIFDVYLDSDGIHWLYFW
jgi:hypothetical protein